MRSEDELRRRVAALVVDAGGQRAFGKSLGVHQSLVSRYLTGGRLTPALAKGLHRRYPALRTLVTAVHFAERHMPLGNEDAASAAAS